MLQKSSLFIVFPMTWSLVTLPEGQLRSPKETLMSVEFLILSVTFKKQGIKWQLLWTVLASFLTCFMGRLVWNATYRELYSLKYTLGKTYHCLKFIFPSFLVHNKQVMGLFKHFSPKWGKRLIKIHSFFVNSEVRNVEICTYFLESAKKNARLEEMGSHWLSFGHDRGTNFT